LKITADTNVLVCALMRDDKQQASAAEKLLSSAEVVAVPSAVLCELFWVLSRSYGVSRERILAAIMTLVNASNVVTKRMAVDAGLTITDAGGDFADSVISYEGQVLGADTLVSFDAKAVRSSKSSGADARSWK
jgi:predicted nucleic-acid-binding protein